MAHQRSQQSSQRPRVTVPNEHHPSDNRYSYIPTPLEMRANSHQAAINRGEAIPNLPQLPPQIANGAQQQESRPQQPRVYSQHDMVYYRTESIPALPQPQLPQQITNDAQNQPQEQAQEHQVYGDQKVELPPPVAQHPANYAPMDQVVDTKPPEHAQSLPQHPAQQQPQQSQAQPYQYHTQSPPPHFSSPPLRTTSVAPDTNPLQSPISPRSHQSFARSTFSGPQDLSRSTTHHPGQVLHPAQLALGGTWNRGLCDCSGDLGTCCLGIWCPCVLYGRVQFRLENKRKRKEVGNLLGWKWIDASSLIMGVACGCQPLLAMIQRTRVRKSYKIEGNIADDCLRSCCCCCCTIIQDEKEICFREQCAEESASGVPYMAPDGMSYAPPPK